jgi:hypothetical protein
LKKYEFQEVTKEELSNLGFHGYLLVGILPGIDVDSDDRGYRSVEKFHRLIFVRSM